MLKSNAAKNYWPGLQLKAKSGNEESSTTVIFNDEMSNGLDPGYDVGMFSSGSEVEVYTALVKDNGVNFARQALSAYEGGRSSIAVGVDSENGGTVVFSGTVIPLRNRSFILEDRETGILTDLGKSTYTVTLPANTFGTGRFFIHASYDRDNRPKTDDPDLENMRIWSSFGRVNIQGQTGGMAICEVFNALGQKIFETRLTDPEYNSFSMPAEARGVHFVKVTDGAKITTRKVIFL